MPAAEEGTRRPTGRIAFARIVQNVDQLPTDLVEELRSALTPGTRVERHRRAWMMGQVREEDGLIYGRIGFQSASGSTTEVWNETKNDFEEMTYPNGQTSPFAIRMSDFRIAYQLRGAIIRRQSFVGAFQALLREGSGSLDWKVEPLRRLMPFQEWRQGVDRVTRLAFRLERPNPRYGDRDFVEALIEATGSELANVVLRTGEDDISGLNVDSDFVAQAIEHAERYGTFKAVGERQVDGDTEQVEWDRASGGEVEARTVGADPQTGEVPQERLGQELASLNDGDEAGLADGSGA